LLALVVLLGACGDDHTGPAQDAAVGATVTVAEVARHRETIIRAQELGGGRLGLVTSVPAYTDTICPDCEAQNIPDDECPAVCSRERLEWTVVDAEGDVELGPVVLRTFVHPWPSTYVGFVQSARLAGGDVALAWSLCEGPPARSCDAEYAVFTESGAPVVPRLSLYDDRYGELTMVADPARDAVLIARSSDLVVRAGVFAVVLAADGTRLRDFERIGSSAARHAIALVDEGGFVVLTEDRQPLADDSACAPCERLDACLGPDAACSFGGLIAPEAGLWATRVPATGPVERRRIATGWDGDLYHPHQTYAAVATAAGLAVASWWDVPARSIAAYVEDGDAFRAVALPLAGFGVEPPARWLGVAATDDGGFAVYGEGLVPDSEFSTQPHGFFAAGLTEDGFVAPGIVGDLVRGNGFRPTGDFGTSGAVLSMGILDAAGMAYDHWRVYRFTAAE
jgi:hypothetical protein